MDALKFLQEFDRMCNYYEDKFCKGCPREGAPLCDVAELDKEGRAKLIGDVEQWSKEHPQRTRLQDFMEKYPNAQICESGVPIACCKSLGYCKRCDPVGNNCEACWNMPVEED